MKSGTTRFFISGDIVNTRNESGKIVAAELESVIKSADYSVCNFEAPVEGHGAPISKSGPNIQNKQSTIMGLREQGFDLLLLANNHMMDFGVEGMLATKALATEEGLDTVGVGVDFEEAYAPLIKQINDLKFGLINACDAQFGILDYIRGKKTAGYAWINHRQIDTILLRLKAECDFVLVFSHAGFENYDIPQMEWRERYRHFCDLGADVVIGSHPHVPQGYERFGSSLIFYSLGNFYFDWSRHFNSPDASFALNLLFEKNKPPVFHPVFHIANIEGNQVRLAVKSERVDLERLNKLLEQPLYEKEHKKMTLDAYKKVVAPNILRAFAPFPLGMTLKGSLKEILATLLGRRKHINKSLLSLHLMRNESHYFVIRNALEYLSDTKD